MKGKGQRTNRYPIETLAFCLVGAWEGSRSCRLAAQSWGFKSPRLHTNLQFLPANGCNRLRGMSPDMSRRQDVKPAAILALTSEESKCQNDMREMLPGAPLVSRVPSVAGCPTCPACRERNRRERSRRERSRGILSASRSSECAERVGYCLSFDPAFACNIPKRSIYNNT